MTSTRLMLWLMANYAIIAAAALYERKVWRCVYFIGAILISVAVLKMTESNS